MLDHYKILTVTHKRVNLKDISQYVVRADSPIGLRVHLEEIKEQFGLWEFMYLATCNRVMYFFDTDRTIDDCFILEFFQHINPLISDERLDKLGDTVRFFEGESALEHLFSVAASIESLVIGERQILGQLREAYEQCYSWGLCGDHIRLAMQQAVKVAKGIYSDTRIGDKPVSVVSLAIQKLLQSRWTKDARILMIGAGETNLLFTKFLAKHHFHKLTVFNRTLEKAKKVAELVGAEAQPLSKLQEYDQGFDVLVVCTGSTTPIITPQLYQQLLANEKGPKTIIDLSVPHNTSEEVVDQFPVQFIEIEGLRNLAKENMSFREQEVQRAKELLQDYLFEFPSLYQQRQLEIALRNLPVEIKAVREKVMTEVFRKEVDLLDENTRELVSRMLVYMEKKCIGIPMKAAREAIIQ